MSDDKLPEHSLTGAADAGDSVAAQTIPKEITPKAFAECIPGEPLLKERIQEALAAAIGNYTTHVINEKPTVKENIEILLNKIIKETPVRRKGKGTRPIENSEISGVVNRLNRNKLDKVFALGIYYWFHAHAEDRSYARAIDAAAFGETFETWYPKRRRIFEDEQRHQAEADNRPDDPEQSNEAARTVPARNTRQLYAKAAFVALASIVLVAGGAIAYLGYQYGKISELELKPIIALGHDPLTGKLKTRFKTGNIKRNQFDSIFRNDTDHAERLKQYRLLLARKINEGAPNEELSDIQTLIGESLLYTSPADAIPAFQQAITWNDKSPNAFYGLSRAYKIEGKRLLSDLAFQSAAELLSAGSSDEQLVAEYSRIVTELVDGASTTWFIAELKELEKKAQSINAQYYVELFGLMIIYNTDSPSKALSELFIRFGQCEKIKLNIWLGYCYNLIAENEAKLENYQKGRKFAYLALENYVEYKMDVSTANQHLLVAAYEIRKKNWDAAEKHLHESYNLARTINYRVGEVDAAIKLGHHYYDVKGDKNESFNFYMNAIQAAEDDARLMPRFEAIVNAGYRASDIGKHELAIELFEEALSYSIGIGWKDQFEIYHSLIDSLVEVGNQKKLRFHEDALTQMFNDNLEVDGLAPDFYSHLVTRLAGNSYAAAVGFDALLKWEASRPSDGKTRIAEDFNRIIDRHISQKNVLRKTASMAQHRNDDTTLLYAIHSLLYSNIKNTEYRETALLMKEYSSAWEHNPSVLALEVIALAIYAAYNIRDDSLVEFYIASANSAAIGDMFLKRNQTKLGALIRAGQQFQNTSVVKQGILAFVGKSIDSDWNISQTDMNELIKIVNLQEDNSYRTKIRDLLRAYHENNDAICDTCSLIKID